MHTLEPYFNWRNLYTSDTDARSPFYGREYSEFEYTDTIYDFIIHPQWDNMGSPTLFMKLLYAEYEQGYCIMELMGEWNDTLHNDVMTLKRSIVDELLYQGINKFILIGENVLNFHPSDDCYYEEWFEEAEDGWIMLINFRDHVLREFSAMNIDQYFVSGGELEEVAWRTYRPMQLFQKLEQVVDRRLGSSIG